MCVSSEDDQLDTVLLQNGWILVVHLLYPKSSIDSSMYKNTVCNFR